jgi:opacity protein-like surface antigen
MKRLLKSLLISALLASAPTVFAQSAANGQPCGWTKLGEASNGSFEHYVDYCKITRAGRYRFAYIMSDYKQPQKSAEGYYQSDVSRMAYDCQQSRDAFTAYVNYYSAMGRGAVLRSYSYPEKQWEFEGYSPGSVGYRQIKTVCK